MDIAQLDRKKCLVLTEDNALFLAPEFWGIFAKNNDGDIEMKNCLTFLSAAEVSWGSDFAPYIFVQ